MKAKFNLSFVTIAADGALRAVPSATSGTQDVPDTPGSDTNTTAFGQNQTRALFTAHGANLQVIASQPTGSGPVKAVAPAYESGSILVQDGETVLLDLVAGDYISVGYAATI